MASHGPFASKSIFKPIKEFWNEYKVDVQASLISLVGGGLTAAVLGKPLEQALLIGGLTWGVSVPLLAELRSRSQLRATIKALETRLVKNEQDLAKLTQSQNDLSRNTLQRLSVANQRLATIERHLQSLIPSPRPPEAHPPIHPQPPIPSNPQPVNRTQAPMNADRMAFFLETPELRHIPFYLIPNGSQAPASLNRMPPTRNPQTQPEEPPAPRRSERFQKK